MECIFCEIKEPLASNNLAYARLDKYPVSKGHLLIVPKRHVEDFFDTTQEEKLAILALVEDAKKQLDKVYSPDGYNIGINCGEASGQTVMHMHLHLIPRYIGDVDDPQGGVRGVIPEKQSY